MAKKPKYEPHVRLYRHELESPAYCSLGPDARALLIEMRALYTGRDNRVFLSLREAMKRLNVGRYRAEKARDDLLDRGFIRLLEAATFTRKTRHAPVYLLTNEPTREGVAASKDYMRWRPAKKNTVSMSSTDGVDEQHREKPKQAKKPPLGVDEQHRQGQKRPSLGAADQHTDSLPPPTPEKRSGWVEPGHVWKARSGALLNTQCATCRVWITPSGLEFDGKSHKCDPASKKAAELKNRPQPRTAS